MFNVYMSVHVRTCLTYRPFDKTLPRFSAFLNWISVRFYESDCTYRDRQADKRETDIQSLFKGRVRKFRHSYRGALEPITMSKLLNSPFKCFHHKNHPLL